MVRELGCKSPTQIMYTHPRPGDKESESIWAVNEDVAHPDGQSWVSIATRLPQRHMLATMVERLHSALAARDLAAALDELRRIVPEYRPSAMVLALAAKSELSV